MIIGVGGKAGSGKDTVGRIIQHCTSLSTHIPYKKWVISEYNYVGSSDWQIKKFAGKLKQIVSILTGIPVEDLEKEEVKNSYLSSGWDRYLQYSTTRLVSSEQPYSHIPKDRMTVRMLLQEVGTDALREVIHPQIWVNALFADYKPEKDRLIGLADRTHDYPDWIITDTRFKNEAKAVKDRGGILIRVNRPGIETGNHPSEVDLDNYKDFDYKIENNSSIEELVSKVKKVLQKEKLIN